MRMPIGPRSAEIRSANGLPLALAEDAPMIPYERPANQQFHYGSYCTPAHRAVRVPRRAIAARSTICSSRAKHGSSHADKGMA